VGQTIAGVVGATRASLADARLLQVAGRDGIALVSSVKDAIGAGTGALMLLVTPRLLTHLGYEGTSVLLSAALLTVPVVAGLARRLPSRLPRWAWALEVRRSERRAFVVPWR